MNLLAPLFLLGGLLVALPIVLHLTRKRRDPVPFPSFLLLRASAATGRWKRRRFRHLPLLILRCLALALLAFAFAQPLLPPGAAGVAGNAAPLDLAVVVDRSASMGIGARAEEARSVAADELGRLATGDRGVVVSFADRAIAHSELTGDSESLIAAVAGITPSDGATRVSAALGLAARLLPAEPDRRREVVLVSDLQRTGFEDGAPSPSLPAGVGLRVHRIGDVVPTNAGVREVRMSVEDAARVAVTASVGFVGRPGADPPTIEAELLVADQIVDRRPVEVAGDRAATVRFAPVPVPDEAREAEVRLSGDAFPADDRFRFVIPSEAAIAVRDFGEAASLHVREALRVGASPAFAVAAGPLRGEGAVREALAGARVALVRNPGRLDAGAARALAAFVRSGGGLVAAAGPRRMTDAVWAELEEVLPARPGEILDRQPAGRISDFDGRHPIFAPFLGEGASSLARVAMYRVRAATDVADRVDVLARYDDARPAVLLRRVDDGVAVLFTSSLDGRWNDLPRRPAFVPLFHRMMETAARHERLPLAYRVGDSVEPLRAFGLAPAEDPAAAEVLVEAPSGARSVVPDAGALRMEEAGFFHGRRAEASRRQPAAANLPLAETDLATLDADEVRLGAVARSDAAAAGEAAGSSSATGSAASGLGTPLWWALLGVLALLLVAEARTANRLTPPRTRGVAEPSSYTA